MALYQSMPVTRTEPFYHDLGRKLAQLREGQGLSQARLGRMLNPQLQRASIANIETGKQRVLSHTLVELARALQVPLNKLVPTTSQPAEVKLTDVARQLSKELPGADMEKLTKRLGFRATESLPGRRKSR